MHVSVKASKSIRIPDNVIEMLRRNENRKPIKSAELNVFWFVQREALANWIVFSRRNLRQESDQCEFFDDCKFTSAVMRQRPQRQLRRRECRACLTCQRSSTVSLRCAERKKAGDKFRFRLSIRLFNLTDLPLSSPFCKIFQGQTAQDNDCHFHFNNVKLCSSDEK